MKSETAGRLCRKALLGVSSLVLTLSLVTITQAKDVYADEMKTIQWTESGVGKLAVKKAISEYPGLVKYAEDVLPDTLADELESVINDELSEPEIDTEDESESVIDNADFTYSEIEILGEDQVIVDDTDLTSEDVEEETESNEENTEASLETTDEDIVDANDTEDDQIVIQPMDYDTAKKYASSLYSNSDLRVPSGISKNEFESYCLNMKNDRGFYSRNAGFIWDTCQEYGFNEFAFIGVSAWEGGWATKGPSYNYYGALGMRFESEHDGIERWTSFMTSSYLNSQGKFYCGGYSLVDIGPKYCSDAWAWDVLARVQDSAARK